MGYILDSLTSKVLHLPLLLWRRHALQIPPGAARVDGVVAPGQTRGTRQAPTKPVPPRLQTSESDATALPQHRMLCPKWPTQLL